MGFAAIVSLGMLVWVSGVSAEPNAQAPKSPVKSAAPSDEEQVVVAVSCKNVDVSRRLEVHTKDAGCVLFYTKSGKAAQIASSQRGVDICQESMKKVQANLEAGGYKCQ